MLVITDPREFNLSGSAVSVGMFDGVHRGHRRVLKQLREQGLALHLPTVAVTFDPHPLATLRPGSCPAFLSTLAGRMDLLASTGHVDYCLVLKFDRQRSGESADDFVRHTLVGMLGMRALIVGENFACGSGRQGTVEYLGGVGDCLGFQVCPVPLRANGAIEYGAHASSTETRRLIRQGDIAGASAMLDRPYELCGTVFGSRRSGGRAIELMVPGDLCTPPAGDYPGTVKGHDVAAPWIDAVLQVRGRTSQSDRLIVRLLVEQDMSVAFGDAMTVRFLDRADSANRSAAFATMALT